MEFDPNNPIIQLCMQGAAEEEKSNREGAAEIFMKAWNNASTGFEKFIVSYYSGRNQQQTADKLRWFETALEYALQLNSPFALGALPFLYKQIADCYEQSGDGEKATIYSKKADSAAYPSDTGPFYHGTRADLNKGDLLTPGGNSNYKDEFIMNHIYFTAMPNGAGLAAALARGDGRERVYIVEPTGNFENDPNVTDKKFPGNPTRSYRSTKPLKIIGELDEWTRLTPEQVKQWKDRLADSKGEIIN